MTQHKTREMWKYPLPHNFDFGFGLSAENAARAHTIVPITMQDNAIVDYETIKTNPENADFAVVAKPNCAAGSTIGQIRIRYMAFIFPSDTEITMLKFNTMNIATAFLNRLDAFDKKTGNDIETILELTHETTDEQVYPLWNGTKLFEGHGVHDLPAEVPGLTTDQQPEGVAFDKEMFFDAMQYYTNKEMLRTVTSKMLSHTVTDPLVNAKHAIYNSLEMLRHPICKFMNPYTFCGKLFSLPQVGDKDQYHLAAQTTAIEHLTVVGTIRFNEFNPDFNFSRA